MRRYFRLFAILCAFAFLLTACGGAGEEEPGDDSPTLAAPDETFAPEETDGQSAPNESDTQDLADEPKTQPVTDEPDAQSATDEPDAQTPLGEPDAPAAPDETDAQPATETPSESDTLLLGEQLPEVKTVGDAVSAGELSYEASPDSCTVYLPEGAKYVPFLVLSADYGGNALLLRRDILPAPRPFNSYSAAYEDSALDRYLNGEYLQELGAVRDLAKASEIVVTDAGALGVSGDAVKTIARKVFLLSCAETGFTDLVNAGKEGAPLSYFDDASHRTASRDNGGAASWWLRTPDTYYLSAAYGVGADGSLGSGNAYNENGVRPALCVPPDAQAFPTNDIVSGQTVYFLSA